MKQSLSREQLQSVAELARKLGRTGAASAIEKALAEKGDKPVRAASAEPSDAPPAPRRRPTRRAGEDRDARWARENLRWADESPVLDLANTLRIFEKHPDYRGRFWFNKAMGRVIDRGVVLLGWQLDALAAEIQERFLPAAPEESVHKALFIVANRAAERKADAD